MRRDLVLAPIAGLLVLAAVLPAPLAGLAVAGVVFLSWSCTTRPPRDPGGGPGKEQFPRLAA